MIEEVLNQFLGKEKIQEIENKLKENNFKKGLKNLIKNSLYQGIVLGIIVLTVLTFLKVQETLLIFSILALIFPLIANYLIQMFLFEKRKQEIEKLIPDALLQASVFPKQTSIVTIISYLGKTNFGVLSQEFGKVNSEIEKGAAVEQALEHMKKRINSQTVNKAINLLIQGYHSGAEMNLIFKETAEEIMETQSLLQERIANLTIEKYTLIFAGGILLPLILGLIVGLINSLNIDLIQGIDFGLTIGERKKLFEAVLLSNQVYIFLYAIIASIFIAQTENNSKKAIVYATILVPLSLIIYNVVQLL